jgi:hypothetical protein
MLVKPRTALTHAIATRNNKICFIIAAIILFSINFHAAYYKLKDKESYNV